MYQQKNCFNANKYYIYNICLRTLSSIVQTKTSYVDTIMIGICADFNVIIAANFPQIMHNSNTGSVYAIRSSECRSARTFAIRHFTDAGSRTWLNECSCVVRTSETCRTGISYTIIPKVVQLYTIRGFVWCTRRKRLVQNYD